MFSPLDLTIFPVEREQKLRSIYRFSMFELCFYRSNLWMHSHRVKWLIEELLPVAQKYLTLDAEKTRVLALVHDDAEMITGDIQAGRKAGMTSKQLKEIDEDEEKAVYTLAATYPLIVHGYSYKELLLHALRKDCLEAQLVSYADKLDAYCESMHELLAGNITLLLSANFYTRILTLFPQKFPDMKEFLSDKESPLTYLGNQEDIELVKVAKYSHLNKPYTKESIIEPTDFHFYNIWKRLNIEKGGEEGMNWLIQKYQL